MNRRNVLPVAWHTLRLGRTRARTRMSLGDSRTPGVAFAEEPITDKSDILRLLSDNVRSWSWQGSWEDGGSRCAPAPPAWWNRGAMLIGCHISCHPVRPCDCLWLIEGVRATTSAEASPRTSRMALIVLLWIRQVEAGFGQEIGPVGSGHFGGSERSGSSPANGTDACYRCDHGSLLKVAPERDSSQTCLSAFAQRRVVMSRSSVTPRFAPAVTSLLRMPIGDYKTAPAGRASSCRLSIDALVN